MLSHHHGKLTKASIRREVAVTVLLSMAIGSHYRLDALLPGVSPRVIAMVCGLAGLMLMSGLKTRPFPRRTAAPVMLWVLFALAAVAASIFHGEREGQLQAVWLLLGIPLLLFNMLPLLLGNRCNFVVCCSFIVTSTCLIVASLVVEPMQVGQSYFGILSGRTPAMARASSMMVIGALGLLSGVMSRRTISNTQFILLSLLLLAGFVMVFSAAYRTGIASCTILLIVFTAANYRRAEKLMRIYALSIVLLLALSVGFRLSGKAEQMRFWETVMAKHKQRTVWRAGVWSGRGTEWRFVISHANLLGHGMEVVGEQPLLHNWHSAFTMVLGVYGIPATLFFTCFWIVSLVYACRYVRVTEGIDPYNQLPVLCIVFFFVYSLGSRLLYLWASGPLFGFLIAIGSVIMREAVQHRDAARPPRAPLANTEDVG